MVRHRPERLGHASVRILSSIMIRTFQQFIGESKNYFKGISKSTAAKKKAQMKKQAEMPDDDPAAYKELPGDTKGKKQLKTSTHTKKYHELYGEGALGIVENVQVSKKLDRRGAPDGLLVNYDGQEYQVVYPADGYAAPYGLVMPGDDVVSFLNKDRRAKTIWKKLKPHVDSFLATSESINEAEKKQSTDRSPIDSEKIETALKNKAEETGLPIGILRAIMRRGMAAWKTGHRPGAGQEQWGYARINSFATGGEGTWGKADADLAKEAREAGFKPKK
jgi:hypothetical protein